MLLVAADLPETSFPDPAAKWNNQLSLGAFQRHWDRMRIENVHRLDRLPVLPVWIHRGRARVQERTLLPFVLDSVKAGSRPMSPIPLLDQGGRSRVASGVTRFNVSS